MKLDFHPVCLTITVPLVNEVILEERGGKQLRHWHERTLSEITSGLVLIEFESFYLKHGDVIRGISRATCSLDRSDKWKLGWASPRSVPIRRHFEMK